MTFTEQLQTLEDPRHPINIRHNFFDILFLTVSAILSQAEGWEDIEEFGKNKLEWLRKYYPFKNGIPSHDTISRVICLIPPDEFNQFFINCINLVRQSQGLEIIALDGKTIKRSFDSSQDKLTALHSISAYATETGVVLMQEISKSKKNEVGSVLEIIDKLEINDTIITADAMSCLKKVTKAIDKKGADYVLQLKNNQAKLLRETQAYFHKVRRDSPCLIEQGYHETIDAGHGRIESRKYTQLAVTDWFEQRKGWTNLQSVVEVERYRQDKHTGQESTEIAYYISSLTVEPSIAAHAIRRHWGIENSLHYVLDVTFREDYSRIRARKGAQNMASVKRLVLNLVKQAGMKASIKSTLKQAAWNDKVREKVMLL